MLTAKQPMILEEKDFLSEGGLMGKLIRKFNWSKTSLGSIEGWTDSLKNAIRLCLTAQFPSLIYCGSEFLVMYNDAFISLAGRKHPEGMLGLPLSESRKEVWPLVASFVTTAYETNKIVRVEDLFLPLDLEGFLEEYYFTLAYIPMGAHGKVEAIFTNVFINTAKVILARQLDTLKEVELRLSEFKSVNYVGSQLVKTLNSYNNKDVPFSLLYMMDVKNNIATLQCAAESIQSGLILSPSTISLKESEAAAAIWPLFKMITCEKHEVVDISQILSVPSGHWKQPPRKAILIPIRIAGQVSPMAVLIAGVSSMRHLDEGYIGFYHSIASLLATAITNAQAYEKEQQQIGILLELGKVQNELGSTIEELKKANESLTKSKESYRILASMSPVGIVHTDAEGRHTYFNPKGFSILGLPSDTSMSELYHIWQDTLHPDDRERVITEWNNVLRNKKDHFKSEYRFVHKDGSVIWVISEAISEKDAAGNILSYIHTLTDITRLKDLLDRQERVVDSLCHELRNPMSGIHGNIKLLLTYLLSLKKGIQQLDEASKIDSGIKNELLGFIAESEESIEAMKSCAKHQGVVINDVLDLSRLEAKKVELREKAFDPDKIIQDALTMVNVDIKSKNLDVELHHSLLDFSVISDPDRIKQIILNLLTNAIKFTPNRGIITIGYQPEEQTAEQCILKFFVEDTGIGISEEGRLKLFNRFAQAEQRTFAEYGGSGLGLSISKQLVELMGGKIELASTLGKGSRFTFTIKCRKLPKVTKKSPKEFKGLPTKSEIAMLQGLVVVIVEDNLINQKLLKRLLDKYGLKCFVANNGQDAIELVKTMKNNIDIMLMDIEMPVMNGLEATQEIRRLEKEQSLRAIHIIGISGNARPEYSLMAHKAGMDAYFTKPYEIEEIVGEIKKKVKSIRSLVSPALISASLSSASEAISKTEKELGEPVQAVAIPVQEPPKDKVSSLRL